MNKQRSRKLALRKETVRTLRQIDLRDAAGGIAITQQFTCGACPSVHQVCLTTHTTTNP
jgi:cytochrome c551/c552